MQHLKWIWQHAKGERAKMIASYAVYAVMPLAFWINPRISAELIDRGIKGGETELIVPLALTMVGVTLARALLMYFCNVMANWGGQGIIYQLRTDLYREMQRKDMRFYDQNRTGDLMTAMSSDMEVVRHNISYIWRRLVFCPMLLCMAIAYYFTVDWIYAVAMLVVAPLIFIVLRLYTKRVRPLYRELRERLSRLSTVAQENIDGNRVVKAFANEQHEMDKFSERNHYYLEQNLKVVVAWLKVYPVVEILGQALTIISLLVGGLLMIGGRMTIGEYWACNALVWAVSNPLRELGSLLNSVQQFFASSDRLIAIQNFPIRIHDQEEPYKPEEPSKGAIELINVTLKYDKNVVLDDVSLSIKPGQTVAIMGETGAGKTTITNLIARFIDPGKGCVMVDGVNVKDWSLHALRHQIGMATQDVFLFSDTIDGNIAYGDPDLPEDQVVEFARKAAADDFIRKMPDGYDTIIGERGVGLSGGQKQRIALARALALRPSILILDDTTSAVDMETEKYIQSQLRQLDFPCTKIIIAQRISSVRHADQIVILKGGRIVEQGTHAELLAQHGFYAEINAIQRGNVKGVTC